MSLGLLGGAAADDSSGQGPRLSSRHEFLKVLHQVIIRSSRPSPAGPEADKTRSQGKDKSPHALYLS